MSDGWSEFRVHWRAFAAATLGLSSGMGLIAYVNSVFAPYLVAEFKWSRAEFALLGMTSVLTLVCIPTVGRLADLFGTRRVAASGIVAFPLLCLALAAMDGSIATYLALQILLIVTGMSTTTTVYTRLAAERFVAHRGLALAACACAPAVVAMVGSPIISAYMDAHGWRAGYRALAGYSALLGLATLLLMPARRRAAGERPERRRAWDDYRAILQTPAFAIIMIGTVLCSLPHTLALSQIRLMLAGHGMTSPQMAMMVSLFAVGVIFGRFLSGLALDRFPTHLVAAAAMGLPFFGLMILAAGAGSVPLLGLAVVLLGLSFGSEGDILGYAAARYFPMAIFGSVLGLLTAATGLGLTLGAALLSLMLYRFDSFVPFMLLTAATVLVGSLNLLRLGRQPALT